MLSLGRTTQLQVVHCLRGFMLSLGRTTQLQVVHCLRGFMLSLGRTTQLQVVHCLRGFMLSLGRTTQLQVVHCLRGVHKLELIVIFNLLWSEFDEKNATFRSASTDLDNALVVCESAARQACHWKKKISDTFFGSTIFPS